MPPLVTPVAMYVRPPIAIRRSGGARASDVILPTVVHVVLLGQLHELVPLNLHMQTFIGSGEPIARSFSVRLIRVFENLSDLTGANVEVGTVELLIPMLLIIVEGVMTPMQPLEKLAVGAANAQLSRNRLAGAASTTNGLEAMPLHLALPEHRVTRTGPLVAIADRLLTTRRRIRFPPNAVIMVLPIAMVAPLLPVMNWKALLPSSAPNGMARNDPF